LVTGGTGTLGQLVVPRLLDAGPKVRVLSRKSHDGTADVEYVTGDLATGAGIDSAVEGTEIVVHLAGGPKGDDEETRRLVQAAMKAGVRHLIYISVIGADRVPLGYFRAKFAAEQVVADSGLPYTTLRAAQFHDFILTAVEKLVKLPVLPVPSAMRFQPVDADEVAARMVELTLGEPAGRVPDLAGPKVYGMAELVRGYLRARGKRRLLVPLPLVGKVGRVYRNGDNLETGQDVGHRTWEEFLAERVSP
jgi:uncharacterized protein YbjT (DUF2867 family)